MPTNPATLTPVTAGTSFDAMRMTTPRAWYAATIFAFLNDPLDLIMGRLAQNSEFTDLPTQKAAWIKEIEILKSTLQGLTGSLFLEFTIPRMGRRIDAVLLVGTGVIAVEFKVGEIAFHRAAIDQVWDYSLDLKNFHEASHGRPIVPLLVATEGQATDLFQLQCDSDGVFRPIAIGVKNLRLTIDACIKAFTATEFDHHQWAHAPYHPTPTIIEAARSLYAQHSVEAIARHDAGARNLHTTSRRIDELIDEAVASRQKIIIFVTGVPGAGKTLVGLNVATRHRRELEEETHAVYLSGNEPLVAVLREALTRDEVTRRKAQGENARKGKVGEGVKAFIQNIHHFRDEALIETRAPFEHVVIYDEAQRAWNLRQTASFMLRKKKRPGFTQSEPEFLISCMDRHTDWAVIICLVGGGQEINTGEAGIEAWLDAVNKSFPHWHVYISDRLLDSEYAAGNALAKVQRRNGAYFDESLHLAVSMRSFRAESVSEFVKALLDLEIAAAREAYARLAGRFPIAITRDLEIAKQWVRTHARGSERYGLVASSKAQRLKPHAIDIRVSINPVHWFLNDKDDTRSSYYLEDAATEFQVQGLELDWTCVTWDGDLRHSNVGWSYHDFRGDRWINIANSDNRNYLRNAYRVLLTRARQGMVIFVPPGAVNDPTRRPEFYDRTFNYLTALGMPVL